MGQDYQDFGTFSDKSVDYPEIAKRVAEVVADGDFDRGILICGTGIGMCIAANKVKGIRAAMAFNAFSACRMRQHNDVNIMCLGAQIIGPWLAKDLIIAFIKAEFSKDEDCRRRVRKLHELELEAVRELKDKV